MKFSREELNTLIAVFAGNHKARKLVPGERFRDEHRDEAKEIAELTIKLLKMWGKIADK